MLPSRSDRRWQAEWTTGVCAALLLVALEVWFPLFFLNDDNLNGSMPLWVEMGRNLLAGRNPFVSQHLMGGGYRLYTDPSFVGGSLHPWMLASGAICNFAPPWWVVELVAGPFLVLAAVSFCWMARRMAVFFGFELPGGRLVFVSVAYAFAGCNLVMGANWSIFLAWPSALCLVAGALVLPSRKASVLVAGLALVHGMMGSHPQASAYSLLALAGWAVFLRLHTGRIESYSRLLMAGALAALLLSPLLVPAIGTFGDSFRGTKDLVRTFVSPHLTPTPLFLLHTLLLGPHGPSAGTYQLWQMSPGTYQTTPFIASTWALIVCALGYRRGLPGRRLVWGGVAGLVVAFFLTAQIPLIAEMLTEIPLLRSFRWPMRQFFLVAFFLSVAGLPLLAAANARAFWAGAVAGSLALGCAFALNGVPFFNYGPRSSERWMVISGEGKRVWDAIRRDLPADAIILPTEDIENVRSRGWRGFGWLAGFNYPCLFEVRSASGYSVTKPRALDFNGRSPYAWPGVLLLEADLALAHAAFPKLHEVRYAPGPEDALLVTSPEGVARRYPFRLPPLGVRDVPHP